MWRWEKADLTFRPGRIFITEIRNHGYCLVLKQTEKKSNRLWESRTWGSAHCVFRNRDFPEINSWTDLSRPVDGDSQKTSLRKIHAPHIVSGLYIKGANGFSLITTVRLLDRDFSP